MKFTKEELTFDSPRIYDPVLGLDGTVEDLLFNAVMGAYKENPDALHRVKELVSQIDLPNQAEYLRYLEESEREAAARFSPSQTTMSAVDAVNSRSSGLEHKTNEATSSGIYTAASQAIAACAAPSADMEFDP